MLSFHGWEQSYDIVWEWRKYYQTPTLLASFTPPRKTYTPPHNRLKSFGLLLLHLSVEADLTPTAYYQKTNAINIEHRTTWKTIPKEQRL